MTTQRTPLPLLPGYDPGRAAEWDYVPNQQALADNAPEWARAHRIKPAASDEFRIHALLIDVQKDFCHPEGTLYVAGRSGTGAVEDNRRLAEWTYRNLDVITDITTTMDTHFAYQIFFPSFWIDENEAPLTPHRVI
ncbi:MAG TPA: nicotinamidase, partial [Kofleriaceae bacterium]|nr:nicotinamidase [Kofleriaceae bacterium]